MNYSANIPTELLMEIINHLSPDEKYNCLLICKYWYEIFRYSLYNTIDIKNVYQLQLFFKCLLISEQENVNTTINSTHFMSITNGQLIKQIYIHTNQLSTIHLQEQGIANALKVIFEKLPILTPNLEILDFDPKVWKDAYFHYNIDRWKNLRQLPILSNLGTSLPYLQILGKNLTTLSIQSNMLINMSTRSALISILSMVPNIKKFKIKGDKAEKSTLNLAISDIEVIHALLPSLDSLEITGDNIKMAINNRALNQLINFPTISNLKSLLLECSSDRHIAVWIYYVAHKYPNIQQLHLNIAYEQALNVSDNINNMVLIGNEHVQVQNSCYFSLLKKCHYLQTISISCPILNIWLNHTFFELLKENNPTIQKVTPITKRNNQIRLESEFDTALEYGKDIITALEIEQWRFERKLPSTLNLLKNFSKLSYLEIKCDTYNSEYNVIDMLDYCPLLETLVLEWGTLQLPNNIDTSIKHIHPLKILDLTFMAFTSAFFEYLGHRCPSLANMYITKCKQLCAINDTPSQTVLHINMPNNRFDNILLNGVRLDYSNATIIFNGISSYIKVICIETAKIKHWSHHVDYLQNSTLPIMQKLENNDLHITEYLLNKRQQSAFVNNNHQFWDEVNEHNLNQILKAALMYGYVRINCKAVENILLDGYVTRSRRQ